MLKANAWALCFSDCAYGLGTGIKRARVMVFDEKVRDGASVMEMPGLRPRGGFRLRDGQQAFLQKLAAAFARGETEHLGVFVPGYGKTITAIASFIVGRAMGLCDRLLVFVPRGNLRDQYANAEDLTRTFFWLGSAPLSFCVADADEVFLKNVATPILVSTYQYACSERAQRNLVRWAHGSRVLVVADEAHHVLEEAAWGRAVAAVPRAGFIALSGTPLRADGEPLYGVPYEQKTGVEGASELYYRALHEVTLRDAHAEGRILKGMSAHVADYLVTLVDGDTGKEVQFRLGELREQVRRNRIDIDAYLARKRLRFHDDYLRSLLKPGFAALRSRRAEVGGVAGAPQPQMLVLCFSNRHAASVLGYVQRHYPDVASGRVGMDLPAQHNDATLDAFRRNRIQCLVSVAMVGEGTDVGPLSVIVKADLVSSASATLQQLFRGMRYVRAWPEAANVCDVFCSDDVGVSTLLEHLTREIEQGLRDRASAARRRQGGDEAAVGSASGRAAADEKEEARRRGEQGGWQVRRVENRGIESHRIELRGDGPGVELLLTRARYESSEAVERSAEPDEVLEDALRAVDVSARETELRAECTALAVRLAHMLMERGWRGDVGELTRRVHARAAERFGRRQAGLSLAALERKRAWLERCIAAGTLM